jgi:2-polyprenyl-3-methyl-5-hydroxy-6-metoxy-1,4-benzoquinol methylase
MSRYSARSMEPELMDDLQSGGEIIRQTLRELEKINKLLGGNHVTISGVRKLIDLSIDKTWRIVDVGCGGGEIMKLIAEWARKNEVKVQLIGIDANPNVIAYAEENCDEYPEISFLTIDIFSYQFRQLEFDVLTATLFFHHFSDDQLTNFFSQIQSRALSGVVVNDIHRHWLAYRSINLLTSLFSKSPMVKNDAGVSVLRSFRKNDWQKILGRAGILDYSLKWMWAFRWRLVFGVGNQ